MNLINEYALLIAVALPIAVILGLQVWLFIAGERGTGLLPGFGSYPSIEIAARAEALVEQPVPMQAPAAVTLAEPSNDEAERLAA